MGTKPEITVNTTMKSMGVLAKTLISALAAMAIGIAGSQYTQGADADDATARLAALEEKCTGYAERLATSEAKIDGVQSNMLSIRKDLAEIRATNTQILFILRDR